MNIIEINNSKTRLDTLYEDFLYNIVGNLQADEVLNLMQVNKRLYKFIQQNDFWNIYSYYNKKALKLKNNNLKSNEILSCFARINNLNQHFKRSIRLEGVFSTSQDNSQSISETLCDEQHVFWSSTGVDDPDERDEELIYRVNEGISFIDSFTIKFFFADYLETKIYQCKKILFQSGMSYNNLTYSEEFDTNIVYQEGQRLYELNCSLKQPNLAKVIKLTLKGRIGLQETDRKYYIAVERFKVFGVPIHNISNASQFLDITLFVENKIKKILENEQNIDNKTKEEKKKILSKKYLNEIITSTEKIVETITKNYLPYEQNMFKEEEYQQKQAEPFIETLDIQLFNQFPELRINKYAYDKLMKDEDLMKLYLESCVNNRPQLTLQESIAVMVQKINFNLVSKYMKVILEIFKQAENKYQQTEEVKIKFQELIIQVLPNSFLTTSYENFLNTIEYFTISGEYYTAFFKQIGLHMYPSDPKVSEEVIKHFNSMKYVKNTNPQATEKQFLYLAIHKRVLPSCAYIFLKVLFDIIAKEQNNLNKSTQEIEIIQKYSKSTFIKEEIIEEEKNQSNDNAIIEEEQIQFDEKKEINIKRLNHLISPVLTEEQIKYSIRAQYLKEISQIRLNEELIQYDIKMREQANEFINTHNIKLLFQENNPINLRQNTYVFDILMNSEQKMQEYLEQIELQNQGQKEYILNEIESISVFVTFINYNIYGLLLDPLIEQLNLENTNQNRIQLKKVNVEFQKIFDQYLRLKEQPYSKILEKCIFTDSFLRYYYILKPFQNYINLTEDDINLILNKLFKQQPILQSNKLMNYKEYFHEMKQHSVIITQLFTYIINNPLDKSKISFIHQI